MSPVMVLSRFWRHLLSFGTPRGAAIFFGAGLTFAAAFFVGAGGDEVAGGFVPLGAKKYLDPESVWTRALSAESVVIGDVVIDSLSEKAFDPVIGVNKAS